MINPETSLTPGARLSVALKFLACAVLFVAAAAPGRAAEPAAKPLYPAMAPLEQYLMPRDAEIALARTAGPESITRDAEVLILGPNGFETVIPGHNGFVCLVQRSWSDPCDDPEFWNPKVRSPICWNAAAARYCVPLMVRKTKLVLEGNSPGQIFTTLQAALAAGEFPPLGAGAMSFMMARDSHLNDAAGHWHPHLMFFMPREPASAWGANLPNSPVLAITDELDHVTTFLVPVKRWFDGTPDTSSPTPAIECAPAPASAAKP